MAEVEQQPETETPRPKKRRILRSVLFTLLIVFVLLIASFAVMFSTDKGSKFLLNRVLERQQIIHYEYEGGNLLSGIILKNILVTLKPVDVKIDRADVTLGWRAILKKEIHLNRADVRNLQIISKHPPSDKPFKFNEIRLPFVLRLDTADVDHLLIKTASSSVKFHDIHLNNALWSGTELKFEDSRMDMGYLSVKNASGNMKFEGKYPLDAVGDLNIPALHKSLNIHDIKVVATGSLDTIQAGVATNTPDLLTGWVVLHPVRKHVPMFGELKFKNYHWPLLTEQKLYTKKGVAKFNGGIKRLNIDAITDLSGKNIPQGQYNGSMHTDLVHQLDISNINGQLMNGAVNVAGVVSWKDRVTWDMNGRVDKINPKDKLIPQIIQDFFPPSLDAKIASKGRLENGLHLTALVDFDRYETWNLKLDQDEQKDKKPNPMLLNVAWQNIDRAVPYVGWLSSKSGDAKLALVEGRQNIHVATAVSKNDKGWLPEGLYTAQLNFKNNDLNIPTFSYVAGKGSLSGSAKVDLPTKKRQLKWNAILNAKDFNPQTVAAAAPVNLLNGQVKANGFAKPNQQIIHLNGINLTGRLAQQNNNETVRLTGRSTVAILFKDQKAGGAFKSFAVNYDGALNASQIPASEGMLKFKISGTPELVKVDELKHSGIAGKIYASGLLHLKNGLGWNINASLVRFKPHYFVSSVRGELSGNVKTEGVWSDSLKRINIQKLNIAGIINNKPVRGTGNLAMVINSNQKGFLPQQFEANNLYLSYAKNQVQATGNAQNLRLKINAPALYEIYSGLRGRAYGYLNVQSQPRLQATANLAVDDFGFNQLFSVKKLRIQGELPTSELTPTLMTAKMDNLRSGAREIQHGEISLAGTRKAHILKIQAQNRISKFYVQLAGGFNAKNDWLGQIQNGDFDSLRARLVQRQNASVIYSSAKSELFVGAHCWSSQQSQLCFDQPIRVSKTRGNVSFITQNVDLNDFAAFMPEGLEITGKVNGYAKAAWVKGAKPKIDARLVTRSGVIGLAAEDPQDVGSTLKYNEIAVVAKSVAEGLQLRLDVKTPEIGTGYANVIIDPYTKSMPMRGEIAFDQVQLKVFKPFIQDVRSMAGNLSFAGKIGGTLTQPLFNGEMRLKDGAISMISLPVNLTNIQVYSSIRQDHATINGAFNSGQGAGALTGSVNWKDDPRIQLHLKGENLLMRQAPLITAVVTPDLSLDVLPFKKKLSLSGKVDVPRALISMPEASAPVINVSSDVRIVREGQDQLAILRAARPWDIRADVMVNLGNQVIFQGFDSRIPLAGRLYLSQRGLETAMRANGAIGVSQRVKIEAYGQSLDLNRAIARFNGPLYNPTLDIDANKTVQGSLVGVRVTGTATSPNIQVYNDAGLSEQEALNAIITGRINEGASGISQEAGFRSDVNNTIAAAGISMGLGGTRALTNQIGRTFGLSGLALDAQGTGDDTQVSVTGYITPDLFIRYGVGVFTPVNKLTLRYQMNKRLYLEASQSLERAIDVFYNWRF
ncbi:translocation/assembly module TamB domain-containing protein [Acinetobacter sp. C_4_1]|uniref:translocation/assembly module TamB domain-containing protein n=1 Tax=unclassified Acinetobacter TaxID=196816 RepID=UPI0021B790E7|nr:MULTISPECIES: translocation/assembly module TamB domain-containing protein [unclassified Acinetobacter]MCT8088348.1 translocation/assembly module TamB domain-containing protein [Acinetobacter sp. F_3_1]MCT8097717.1 translocation/assembly module TamB domain-containing protein [Acinetobacter sp. C_3_1]MCT8100373.1 translocation/assembly module TamB domain-containing protein [Acinetobacter sp. C_4_1]MCT8133908.1 translocation/assembly module TamB domain-containing protein [Acinetobacter sp. T_3